VRVFGTGWASVYYSTRETRGLAPRAIDCDTLGGPRLVETQVCTALTSSQRLDGNNFMFDVCSGAEKNGLPTGAKKLNGG